MKNKPWKSHSLNLPKGHLWTARPGCKVFVLQRGAVRFDYPRDWVVQPSHDSIHLYDKTPPDDDCRLAVSCMEIPIMDWSGLPLASLLESTAKLHPVPVQSRGKIQEGRRGEMEWAWRETRSVQGDDRREASSLMCMARKGSVQALITYDFWADDRERCMAVWDIVLDTLAVDIIYDDPSMGTTL